MHKLGKLEIGTKPVYPSTVFNITKVLDNAI